MDTQTTTPKPVAVKPEKVPIDWSGIALFIVLTFGLSWAIWLGSGRSIIHHTSLDWYVRSCHSSNNSPSHTQRGFC